MSVQVKKGDYQLAKIYQTYKNSISEYITISDEEAEQLGFKEPEQTPDPENNDEPGGEEQTQGWPIAKFSFTATNTVPQLHAALNTPGKYCAIILQDNNYIFYDNYIEPYYHALTELEKKSGYILGLGGFVVGTNLNNEIVCYDLADPEIYINENQISYLSLSGDSLKSSSNINYNLNNEINDYLFKYRIHYSGNTLVITNGYDNEFSNNYIYECDYEIYEDENNDIILDLKSVNITDPRYSNLIFYIKASQNKQIQLYLGKNIINQYAAELIKIYPYSYEVKYQYNPNICFDTPLFTAKSLTNISQSFDGTFTLSHELDWYTYNINYDMQIVSIERYNENTHECQFTEINSPMCIYKGNQQSIHINQILVTEYSRPYKYAGIIYNINDDMSFTLGKTIIYNNDIIGSLNISNLNDKLVLCNKILDYENLDIIQTFNTITLYNDNDEERYILNGIYLSSYYSDTNTYGGYRLRFINDEHEYIDSIYDNEFKNYIIHNQDYFAQLLNCQPSIIMNNIKYTSISYPFNRSYIKSKITSDILKQIINYEKSFKFYICVNNKYLKFEIPYLGYIENNKIYKYENNEFNEYIAE